MSKTKHIILSGGVGSRLWPLSTKSQPKQYLPLIDEVSLLEKTIERNENLIDELIIVCNVQHEIICKDILKNKFKADYIIESISKNTAAAVAFAAFSSEPEDILIVTPADHHIDDVSRYESCLEKGIHLSKQGYLVTFGIKPDRPETGYGYIKYHGNDVEKFVEKPSYDKANEYIKSDNFLWNSGIFCFKVNIFLAELKKYSPEIYENCQKTYNKSINKIMPLDESQYIPSLSIDVAIMEKSEKIKVVPCDFEWTDLGSFQSLYDYLKSIGHPIDNNGNMTINSPNYTEFVGLNNCIMVYTDNATLILNKDNSQQVKELYSKLEKTKPELL